MRHLVFAAGLAVASTCLAQVGQAVRTVTTAEGTFLVTTDKPLRPAPLKYNSGMDSLLWSTQISLSIPENVALGPADAWVGQHLNQRRLQRYILPGDGVAFSNFPGSAQAMGAVAAAKEADLALYVDRLVDASNQGAEYVLRAYSAATNGQVWSRTFPLDLNWMGKQGIAVSRDGQIVCAMLNDSINNTATLFILDGASGDILRTWFFAGGTAPAIDLNDDGSLCLVTQGQVARLIDTTTATEVFTVTGSGAGGRFRISGNGDTLVVGGFSLHVYRRANPSSTNYTQVLSFTSPQSWFAWGSAVSRDGSIVGVMSHDYGSGYNNRAVRMWNLDTNQLLGTFHANGLGSLQGSISGGELSDDGKIFAVSSWGTEDNAWPEVMIFNQDLDMIGSIDTPGSVFGLALSADGSYVLAGSKTVHANIFGNGGHLNLFQVSIPLPPCYANCDGSTTPPILNVEDFTCFINDFASAQVLPHQQQLTHYANCDQSTTAPVLNVEDFTCFINKFAAGCS